MLILQIRQTDANQLKIYLNGTDISHQLSLIGDAISSYTVASFQIPSAGFTITHTGNSVYDIVFEYEITITIGINAGNMIYATITLPVALVGQTEGLLGNFDGNDNNDFVSRSGTTLSDDASDMEIHSMFAQTCKYN